MASVHMCTAQPAFSAEQRTRSAQPVYTLVLECRSAGVGDSSAGSSFVVLLLPLMLSLVICHISDQQAAHVVSRQAMARAATRQRLQAGKFWHEIESNDDMLSTTAAGYHLLLSSAVTSQQQFR